MIAENAVKCKIAAFFGLPYAWFLDGANGQPGAAAIAEKLGLDSPESEAIDSATARRLLGGISARTFYLYVRNYPELRMGCSRRYSRTRVMELKRLRQCGRMRFDRHKLKQENE